MKFKAEQLWYYSIMTFLLGSLLVLFFRAYTSPYEYEWQCVKESERVYGKSVEYNGTNPPIKAGILWEYGYDRERNVSTLTEVIEMEKCVAWRETRILKGD